MFYRGSRYEIIPNSDLTSPDGRVIRYKRTRFIPPTRGIFPYQVTEGDRLDLIAYRHYKDPEQFWRICDANGALRPDNLTDEPGRQILIPMPMV